MKIRYVTRFKTYKHYDSRAFWFGIGSGRFAFSFEYNRDSGAIFLRIAHYVWAWSLRKEWKR